MEKFLISLTILYNSVYFYNNKIIHKKKLILINY